MKKKMLSGTYHEENYNGIKFVVQYVGKDQWNDPVYKVSAEKDAKSQTCGFAESVELAINDCIGYFKQQPPGWI